MASVRLARGPAPHAQSLARSLSGNCGPPAGPARCARHGLRRGDRWESWPAAAKPDIRWAARVVATALAWTPTTRSRWQCLDSAAGKQSYNAAISRQDRGAILGADHGIGGGEIRWTASAHLHSDYPQITEPNSQPPRNSFRWGIDRDTQKVLIGSCTVGWNSRSREGSRMYLRIPCRSRSLRWRNSQHQILR